MFEENKEKFFTPKDIKEPENIKGEDKQIEEIKKEPRCIFKGPFILRMKILKAGNYRLDGKLYKLIPGDYFEGSNLSPKKREILINTKFIVME